MREGGGEDAGGREAELEKHRVEGPDVGRKAAVRGDLQGAGEGGGVPGGAGAGARQRGAGT
uniref:Uncharacterized protein n=1 Tax=Arundo donax TaxID=35708 RepID=A0A0A9BF34_ARUDO